MLVHPAARLFQGSCFVSVVESAIENHVSQVILEVLPNRDCGPQCSV